MGCGSLVAVRGLCFVVCGLGVGLEGVGTGAGAHPGWGWVGWVGAIRREGLFEGDDAGIGDVIMDGVALSAENAEGVNDDNEASDDGDEGGDLNG